MAKPTAQKEVQTEIAGYFSRYKIVEEIAKTARTAIVFGSAAVIAYVFRGMVHDLAGKETAAKIGVTFLGTITISEGIAWAIATVCCGFAVKRGRTNKRSAARLSRLADFERAIDPNRSSSHLTHTGMPREEDR